MFACCSISPGPRINLGTSSETLPTPSSGVDSTSAQLPKTLPEPVEPDQGSGLCTNVPNGGACGPRGRCWEGVCMPMLCGDARQDPHEQCDDGNRQSDDGCSMHCKVEYCGDGVLQPSSEACEPRLAGDACNQACIFKASCGDGKIDPGEQCDDGNALAQDGCSALCVFEARCGDGKREPPEECDDGNLLNSDGCSAQCFKERCGDGIVQGQEECDDGNRVPDDGCHHCRRPLDLCRNGELDPGEECDDGNFANDDACPNDCRLPVCGDGQREGFEGCDDGNLVAGDGCDSSCKPEYLCGNELIERGEQCDDGNQNNQDDCPNDCQLARCGDGVVEGREACDGPALPNERCDAHCQWIAVCGDGRITANEACDDGNILDNDGCSATCQLEKCGDGKLDPAEQCDDGNVQNDDGCSNCKHDWVNARCSSCVIEHCPLDVSRCRLADSDCLGTLGCYFETGCVTGAATPLPVGAAMGALACFCGSSPVNACIDELIAPDPQGVCREAVFEAFSTRVPARVVRDFTSPELGAGRANLFANCMARFCHEACYVNAPRPLCDPATCDDQNPCTRSFCDEEKRCVHEPMPQGKSCEFGVCADGECVQCLQDVDCGQASTCQLTPRCVNRRCVSGEARVCEQDDNPCTASSCIPDQGCVDAPLEDGSPCATSKTCINGVCTETSDRPGQTVVIPVTLQGSESYLSQFGGPWYNASYAVKRSFFRGTVQLDQVAFHCFDLSSVQGLVVQAQLRVVQPSGSYQSQHAQERVIYRDLGPGQSCQVLSNSDTKPNLRYSVASQLSSGSFKAYGQLEVDASINQEQDTPRVSVLALSSDAVNDINRSRVAGEIFPIGVFLELQEKPSVDDGKRLVESVFFGSTGDEVNELVLQVKPL